MPFRTLAVLAAAAGTLLPLYTGGAAPRAGGRTGNQEPRIIEVTARRFAFEPQRIEVAEGDTVRLVVRSADGVHGVQIRKFRVKAEVPRGGVPVSIEFTASAAGEFPIICSEYCGQGHEHMRGLLVVAPRQGGQR